jgi:hypothetical protein
LESLLLDNVRRADVPEVVFHWGHPALSFVALGVALLGAYSGWQIRQGGGDDGGDGDGDGSSDGGGGGVSADTVKRARAMHPPLMIAAGARAGVGDAFA